MPKLGKQIAEQRLPNRHALNQITGGDPTQRSIMGYAKETPADLSGVAQMGTNILTPASVRPANKIS